MSTFENAVDSYLRKNPSEDAGSAKRALMALYAIMVEVASQPEQSRNWYRVQQLQTWSPLRFFWDTLATSESIVIRTAAKGNICEADGRYSDDNDISEIMARNMEVMQEILSGPEPERLQAELNTYQGLPEAQELWVKAGFGRFTPHVTLTVREL